MTTLWELNNVSLETNRAARLRDVTVRVESGLTAVLGYSGCGKTSLLNLLVEFEKPSRGTVTRKLADSRLPLFWVPQNGGLWNHVTAQGHVDAVSGDESWLAMFDLEHRENSRPPELSQGERARLAVARAVASQADVLVMDEPLAHVDPGRVTSWFDVIVGSLAPRVSGTAIAADGTSEQMSAAPVPGASARPLTKSLVFATHQPELVLRYAANVICLDAGGCVFSGSVRDLYEKPANSRLASLLGHGNWISKDESAKWLDHGDDTTGVVRPEQLRVEKSNDGKLRVVWSRDLGAIKETRVCHEASKDERTFVHSPGLKSEPGDWVRLVVLE